MYLRRRGRLTGSLFSRQPSGRCQLGSHWKRKRASKVIAPLVKLVCFHFIDGDTEGQWFYAVFSGLQRPDSNSESCSIYYFATSQKSFRRPGPLRCTPFLQLLGLLKVVLVLPQRVAQYVCMYIWVRVYVLIYMYTIFRSSKIMPHSSLKPGEATMVFGKNSTTHVICPHLTP